jgi:hypothetical protein
MAAVKFETNFVSALANIGPRLFPPDEGGDAFTGRLEDLLARAQTAYAQRRYRDAVALYKQVQSWIFTLLNPRHQPNRHIYDDRFMLPVSAVLETTIAEAALKLAEVTLPSVRPHRPPIGIVGTPIPAAASRFDQIGFALDVAIPSTARDQAALGAELLGHGFADQAATVLQASLDGMGQLATPAGKALAASVALNLSSAHVLADRPAEAQTAAAAALGFFTLAQDPAGQARALHNQAVAFTKAGNAPAAQAAFERAAALVPPPAAAPAPADGVRSTLLTERLSPLRAEVAPDLSSFIARRDASRVAVDVTNDGTEQPFIIVMPQPVKPTWSWTVPAGQGVVELAWKNGVRPQPPALIDAVYRPRLAATRLADLALLLTGTGETNAYLTHIYAFVVPQALGDCFSQLGQYELAESYYLQAAGYSFANPALELPALWVRLAENTLRWGDALYRSERIDECRAIYAKLISEAGTAPDEPLYTLPAFAGPADDAKRLIAQLADPAAAAVNPAITRPLLTAWARWQYLLAGLDFFGTTFTPVLTFEYLQQASSELAQRAVQAEREYVDFQARAEAAGATRRELQSAAAMADAAVAAQNEQYLGAQSDAGAADAAVGLAQQRLTDARKDKDAYATDGYWQYVGASIAAAHAAHSDWYEGEIRQLAANMEQGSWSGDAGKLSAAATLLGGQKSYEYQLGRLQDAIDEMSATLPVAQQQAAAAHHRAESARLQYEAARTHAALADDALDAFDANVFTPEVWSRMANVMRGLSQDYQDWAIRSAKLMERAYNFENDDDAHVIRSEYPGAQAAGDLLGADFLLRDITSFTYRFVANQRAKQSQLKDVISLANQYPFDFYRFQQTGRMTFETTLHDADQRHPGFYQQRIAAVEVEIVGLLPAEGVQGSLRAGGISRYRGADGGERTRLHTTDTLALSEYALRNDGFVFRVDPRMHGLFEGHGVATTWTLDLPRRSNNADYRLITDVRLVLYYGAYYDRALHDRVLTAPPKPGELIHVRSLLLRFDFPEAWYTLLERGEAVFTVTPEYLPRNESAFRTHTLALVLSAADGVSPAGVALTVTPPGKAAATLSTDAGGQVAAQAGNPLALQLDGDVLGDWRIALRPAAGSPLLGADGKLDGDKLEQLALLFQYQFTWPD